MDPLRKGKEMAIVAMGQLVRCPLNTFQLCAH